MLPKEHHRYAVILLWIHHCGHQGEVEVLEAQQGDLQKSINARELAEDVEDVFERRIAWQEVCVILFLGSTAARAKEAVGVLPEIHLAGGAGAFRLNLLREQSSDPTIHGSDNLLPSGIDGKNNKLKVPPLDEGRGMLPQPLQPPAQDDTPQSPMSKCFARIEQDLHLASVFVEMPEENHATWTRYHIPFQTPAYQFPFKRRHEKSHGATRTAN